MDAQPVDPRDTECEQPHPVYRVYFWDRPPAPPGVGAAEVGWVSDEWRVTEADDVHEVLAWAAGPTGSGRHFELFVEADNALGHGLLRLAGSDPTTS
ncbi:MAG: hypothetical protein ACRD0H_12050 [Actinomycetes bacterium]